MILSILNFMKTHFFGFHNCFLIVSIIYENKRPFKKTIRQNSAQKSLLMTSRIKFCIFYESICMIDIYANHNFMKTLTFAWFMKKFEKKTENSS